MSAEKSRNPYFNMLLENRVNPTGFRKREWDVSIPADTPFEKILGYAYWKQAAAKFGPFHTLYVLPDDAAYYAELLVLHAEPGVGAKVRVKYFDDLNDDGEAIPSRSDDFQVEFRGFDKWCIIRKSDSVKIAKGLDTKADAQRELSSYIANVL